jgi:hypothetical protein
MRMCFRMLIFGSGMVGVGYWGMSEDVGFGTIFNSYMIASN